LAEEVEIEQLFCGSEPPAKSRAEDEGGEYNEQQQEEGMDELDRSIEEARASVYVSQVRVVVEGKKDALVTTRRLYNGLSNPHKDLREWLVSDWPIYKLKKFRVVIWAVNVPARANIVMDCYEEEEVNSCTYEAFNSWYKKGKKEIHVGFDLVVKKVITAEEAAAAHAAMATPTPTQRRTPSTIILAASNEFRVAAHAAGE